MAVAARCVRAMQLQPRIFADCSAVHAQGGVDPGSRAAKVAAYAPRSAQLKQQRPLIALSISETQPMRGSDSCRARWR
jgi:predicted lysophospholipase L1 biosynthesis ABC-type transport system permease subunit